MPESFRSGIYVEESSSASESIAGAPASITAFVGRTARGPLNRPVPISSFAEYQHWFGGLWPASTLSYAVEQFFEHGGRDAIVVRVINGGRSTSIALPAGADALLLQAVNPGSREVLRASVDYDNVASHETDRFNLVIQRVRGRHSEHVEDQEIYTRLSVQPDNSRFVARVLLDSELVRVHGEVPPARPQRTISAGMPGSVGYAYNRSDGDDGRPLTNYDLIGSASERSGLFALQDTPFNLLCLPPLTRELDIGATLLLVAARFCRQHRALLLIDPRREWASVDAVIDGLRQLNFASENAAIFFPRLVMRDNYRARDAEFAPCGVAAAMLARAEAQGGCWLEPWDAGIGLRGLRYACHVSAPDCERLQSAGINAMPGLRERVRPPGLRVLGNPQGASSDWRSLPVRRLVLHIIASIERGTRWVVFERNDEALRERIRLQVGDFLETLFTRGALAGRSAGEAYFVVCDTALNDDAALIEGSVNLAVGFATSSPGSFQTFHFSQRIGDCRVRRIHPVMAYALPHSLRLPGSR